MLASILGQFGRNGANAVNLVEKGKRSGEEELFEEAVEHGRRQLYVHLDLHSCL